MIEKENPIHFARLCHLAHIRILTTVKLLISKASKLSVLQFIACIDCVREKLLDLWNEESFISGRRKLVRPKSFYFLYTQHNIIAVFYYILNV
jgi:hypothetical protein